MELMAAVPAKPSRVQAVARSTGIFELTFEQDIPRSLGQCRENLSCASEKLMQLEREKCARS